MLVMFIDGVTLGWLADRNDGQVLDAPDARPVVGSVPWLKTTR